MATVGKHVDEHACLNIHSLIRRSDNQDFYEVIKILWSSETFAIVSVADFEVNF